MRKYQFFIALLIILSIQTNAERIYTDEEKEVFMKLWSTGKSIALIASDDKMNAEVKALLSLEVTDEIDSNAYIYLVGIAEDTAQPYESGLSFYQNILKDSSSVFINDEYKPRPKELKIPEFELTCEADFESCFKKGLDKQSSEVTNINRQYLDIYLQLLKYKYYQQVPESETDNTSMQLRYVIFLQRFFHQQVVLQSAKNNSQLLSHVLDEHHVLRQWLVSSDKLITKLMIFQLFNKNIDLLSFLFQKKIMGSAVVNKNVEGFTKEELAYTSTLLKEKSQNYRNLMKYNNSLVSVENNPGTQWAQSLMVKGLSKPNISLNNDFIHIVKPLLALDKLDAQAFKNKHSHIEFKVPEDKIRNMANGLHQLFFDSYPNSYIKLKSVLFELNLKIHLLTALSKLGNAEKVIYQSKQGHTAYQNQYDLSDPFIKDNHICYTGITERKQSLSCLKIY